jgi:hypothetical protein
MSTEPWKGLFNALPMPSAVIFQDGTSFWNGPGKIRWTEQAYNNEWERW